MTQPRQSKPEQAFSRTILSCLLDRKYSSNCHKEKTNDTKSTNNRKETHHEKTHEQKKKGTRLKCWRATASHRADALQATSCSTISQLSQVRAHPLHPSTLRPSSSRPGLGMNLSVARDRQSATTLACALCAVFPRAGRHVGTRLSPARTHTHARTRASESE